MQKKIQNLSLVILIIGILTLLISCRDLVTEIDEPTAEAVVPVATMDISAIEAELIENEVIAGDILWKILNVDEQGVDIVSADNYTLNSVRGKFLILEFILRNNSSESRILYDLNVIDNKGRVFSLCLPAFAFFSAEEGCSLVDIIPGIDYTLVAPFDVSADSEGLILEVTDLLIPPVNKAYIDLGI